MNPQYYSAVTTLINYVSGTCSSHKLVNSFNMGESYDDSVTGNESYPKVFLELPLTANWTEKSIEWDVAIIVMDIQKHEGTDQIEKLSLTFDITNDLFQKFRSDNTFYFEDSFNSMSLTEFTDDLTAGWRSEFKLKQAIPMNRCDISDRFNP